MKILTRYILREFLKPFILSVFSFSVIILIVQVFNDIHLILEFKPGPWATLKYFLFHIPAFMVQITPIACLFGVLFSLSSLSKSSELIAMRAGGVSIFLVAVPLFLSGIVICLLCILFTETVVPRAESLERRVKFEEIQHQPEPSRSLSRRNISMIGADGRIYHIGAFDGATKTMSDILILEFDSASRLRMRLDAKSAFYQNGVWNFREGYLRTFDETGNETSDQGFALAPIPLPEKPDDFLKEQKPPEEMGLVELYQYVKELQRNGSDCHKEMVELYQKIAVPFGCVILALLGIPWGWTMGKYSGVVTSFGICILVAFFYIGGMQITEHLGASGFIPPFWASWSLNLLFAGLGPLLLIRKNR
jgi:lipopolysaccharide export system permease protein